MPFLSGKQAFLEILVQEGVECMFGNPGTTELPLMDGLARESRLRYILALPESVAVALGEVAEGAELLGAPVYTECVPSTCSFPFTHPLYRGPFPRLGVPIRNLLMQHDLVFSVGGDFFP